ncbi:MAG: hypothetical protein M3081_19090 [Gemmatimonadota bacterium]|nr:hypothetical protein [Gemmatimonadota bacterium]
MRSDNRVAIAWLATFVALGVALALLYPDSYQQDGGVHFLFARDAWWNHLLLVDVWGRPAFTLLYAIPARLGYLPAKLTTVLICAITAWQTYRVADEQGMSRAGLAIPFLLLQPSVMLLAADTMTEPLFACLFVIALRLHFRGATRAALVVASMLPLARPEGFFVCALWAVWALWSPASRARSVPLSRRARELPLLAAGVAVWWVAAFIISHDPAFLLHNWPHNWTPTGAVYGTAPWLSYWTARNEIVPRVLMPVFAIGVCIAIAARRSLEAVSVVAMLFIVHSLLRHYGMFGSAGYPRYFVCVAPAIALITLEGWNAIADLIDAIGPAEGGRKEMVVRAGTWVAATLALLLALRASLYYVDDQATNRDARAIAAANSWLDAHPVPVRTMAWSLAYMCIVRRCDSSHRLALLDGDRDGNVARLRAASGSTLVFWDAETGPAWYAISDADLRSAGYSPLFVGDYDLSAVFQRRLWYPAPWRRQQRMMLYYKAS